MVAIFVVYEFFILNKVQKCSVVSRVLSHLHVWFLKIQDIFVANCVSTDGSGRYFETVEHIAVTAKTTSKVVCALSAACVCTYRVCCDVFGAQIEAKSRESPFYEVSCLFVCLFVCCYLQVTNLQPLVNKAFSISN